MQNDQEILAFAQEVFRIEAQAINDLSAKLDHQFVAAVQAIFACKGKVVVCGMGKSGIIGKKIAATLASTGTPAFFMHPGEAFHGDLGMISTQDIFLGISNSGETEEIIRLIPSIKANGNIFIALCGKTASTMGKHANYVLDVSVAKEACPLQLAPTSSTTATLAMGDALAVVVMEMRGFKPEHFARFHPGGSLGRRLLTQVKDVMQTENLPFVGLKTPFKEVVLAMTAAKLGIAIVLDNEKLAGVISDGDLRRAWGSVGQLDALTAQELMTKHPISIAPEAKLSVAEQIFIEKKIATLLVCPAPQAVPLGVLQLYNL